MADHLTEEEQIETIKRWIKENGMSIVVPVIVFVLGYGGWEFWKDSKEKNAQEASAQYALIVDALESNNGEDPNTDQIAKAKTAAEQVVKNYGSSMYADMSQLIIARINVDAGELEQAQSRLQAVVNSGVHEASMKLAKARLAKVKVALKQYDTALSLVETPQDEAFKALYAEVRGDVFLAKGDESAANTAYQEALVNLLPKQNARRGIIQLKIDSTDQTSDISDVQAATTEQDTSNNEKPAEEAAQKIMDDKTQGSETLAVEETP